MIFSGHRLGDSVETIFTGLPAKRAERLGEPPTPVVGISDVTVNLPPIDALKTIELAATPEVQRCRLQRDDVVVTARGTEVRAAVVTEQAGAIAGSNLIVVRPGTAVDPYVLAAFLRHPHTQALLLMQRTGSATPGFTAGQLSALRVRRLAPAEQAHLSRLVQLAEDYYRVAVQAATSRRDLVADLVLDALNVPLASEP